MIASVDKDYRPLVEELRKRIDGEVKFDKYSRLLYSTDASIYQIEPIGVAIPRHKGDVQAAIEVARRFEVPLLSRGGGTSLAGQAVGRARWHHRLRSEQFPQTRHAFGGRQAPVVRPPGQGR